MEGMLVNKLIRLELKKFRFATYIRTAMYVTIGIFLFILLGIYGDTRDIAFRNISEVFSIIDTFVKVAFIITASVLLSRMVIDEFKSKSITVMFMYPIPRKKLMTAKLIIVVLYTFIAIILSNIVLISGFLLYNSYAHTVPGTATISMVTHQVATSVINSLAASCLSLIPLWFGMRKYSAAATITSSILIAAFLGSSTGGFTLWSIIAVPFAFAALGVVIGYLTIRKIDTIDLYK
jgi:ABC-type transport system involved in multi-copper enzyme maturation permease subunit